MRQLQNVTGISIGAFMACAFLLAVLALVGVLAAEKVPALGEFIDDLRCAADVPSPQSRCVAETIAAIKREQQEIEAERDRLAAQAEKNARRQAELEALNGKVENYSQFQTEALRFGRVTTGTRFASILQPEVWSNAWCYLDRTVSGGLSRKLELGNQNAGQQVVWASITAKHLADADISQTQLEEAKAACRFPEGV